MLLLSRSLFWVYDEHQINSMDIMADKQELKVCLAVQIFYLITSEAETVKNTCKSNLGKTCLKTKNRT